MSNKDLSLIFFMVNVVYVLFVCSLTGLMASCGSFETLAFFLHVGLHVVRSLCVLEA